MHAHAERGDDQRQALKPAIFLQVLIDLRRRHFLQGAQQVMGQLPQAVSLAQFPGQVRGEVSGHFRVRQRPVSLAGVGQFGVGVEGAELVVGRRRHQAASQQQGAGKFLQAGAADQAQLKVPELLVERGVVRHQGRGADELIDFVHHSFSRWRAAQHGVADAGELFDKRRYAHTGIHQALVAVHDLPALKDDHANLRGPAVAAGGDAGGFKVDDRYAFQTCSYSVQRSI